MPKALNWRDLRSLAESRLYKLTAFFPFIGYVILFSPSAQPFLHFQHHSSGIFPLIDTKYRLYMLYYGLLFIGISSLFMLRMPQMFRVFETDDSFAQARAGDSLVRKGQFLEECR